MRCAGPNARHSASAHEAESGAVVKDASLTPSYALEPSLHIFTGTRTGAHEAVAWASYIEII